MKDRDVLQEIPRGFAPLCKFAWMVRPAQGLNDEARVLAQAYQDCMQNVVWVAIPEIVVEPDL